MILTPEQIECFVNDSLARPPSIEDARETLAAYAEIVQKVAFTQCDGLYATHGMEGRYTIDVETVRAARKLRRL